MKALNLQGQVFERLKVLNRHSENTSRGAVQWVCQCDCGNQTLVIGSKLIDGHVKSCGCLIRDTAKTLAESLNKTHGMSGSAEYSSWQNMKDRCLNPQNVSYNNYGGRGIRIHDPWINSFDAFIADMGAMPDAGLSIERNSNDGNYEPGNCRWATHSEQQNNKRTNVFYEYQGKRWTQTQLCSSFGVNPQTFVRRIKNGMNIKEALNDR